MSKLLIDESPLQVIPSLAVAIGLNEAIVLQQVHYLLKIAKTTHNGKKWVYKSVKQWREEQFPFFSEDTVKRTLKNLKDKGLIDCEKLADDKYNRVNYYTINYENLNKIDSSLYPNPLGQNAPMEDSKMHQSTLGQNAPMLQENTTEITTEITTESENTHTLENPNLENPAQEIQNLNELENPTPQETFEFLKSSLVFGSDHGIISEREINLAEITALTAEVTAYWSTKNLTKQQILAKILGSVSRLGATERIEKYTLPHAQPTAEAPVMNPQYKSVSPFERLMGVRDV